MKPMRAGLLRQRVTLQRPQQPEVLDSFGQPKRAWIDVGTYWAEVRPLRGREAIAARQVKAEATHAMTLRYLGDGVALDPTCRFLFGARVFNVAEVLNVEERDRRYELIVTEILKTGKV